MADSDTSILDTLTSLQNAGLGFLESWAQLTRSAAAAEGGDDLEASELGQQQQNSSSTAVRRGWFSLLALADFMCNFVEFMGTV